LAGVLPRYTYGGFAIALQQQMENQKVARTSIL